MNADAELAMSHLGLSNCVEKAVLDPSGWVAHMDTETLPVSIKTESTDRVHLIITFTSTEPLTAKTNVVVLEHKDEIMMVIEGRCAPVGGSWTYIMMLRLP